MLFIDYKKAFDSTQRQILFDILKSRNIPDTLLKVTGDIHTQNKMLIKCNSKFTRLTEINKGVCKGFPLSSTLFNTYLDEIITKCQKEDFKQIPLSRNQQILMLLFVDD